MGHHDAWVQRCEVERCPHTIARHSCSVCVETLLVPDSCRSRNGMGVTGQLWCQTSGVRRKHPIPKAITHVGNQSTSRRDHTQTSPPPPASATRLARDLELSWRDPDSFPGRALSREVDLTDWLTSGTPTVFPGRIRQVLSHMTGSQGACDSGQKTPAGGLGGSPAWVR